jgi:hypothetical protein
MTPTTDIREIFSRAGHGLASDEVKALAGLLVRLVWEVREGFGHRVTLCRFCGCERRQGHADFCEAREVA